LKKNTLYFLPLGGSGEIGMNLNLYGYNDQWVIVDMGLTFGHKLGIELVVPDPHLLKGKNILGVVATHGHEDHIGAIPHLMKYVDCPIYATPFTTSLIKRKLNEAYMSESMVKTIPLKGKFTLGPFGFEYVTLTHSIPEPNALAITTPKGVIFHTGDWKIDPNPMLGDETDVARIIELGDAGILALVGDSTNALEDGWTGSEKGVREELIKQVCQIKKGAVAVTCFASNVARLETCMIAATEAGRYPVLVGRSLCKMYESAKACGYMKTIKAALTEDDLETLPRDKVLIICTGSQGESRAALSRIASGSHPRAKLLKGETVIFSSRVIPGNEREIAHVHNQLVERHINVITPKQADVHVSGHPSRDELFQMYAWVRPKISIPVHGEIRHMQAHAELAIESGVSYALVPQNGDLIAIDDKGPVLEKQFELVPHAVDGTQLIPLNHTTFRDRTKLMTGGVAFATVLLERNGDLREVYVDALGVFEVDDTMLDRFEDALVLAYESITMDAGKPSIAVIEERMHTALRREIMSCTGKKTSCLVHVMEV
jgi:ribonuclease J